jgi:glucose/mannose-6-phosphate isomerase
MIETIRTYNTQFQFVPEIVNEHLLNKNFKHIILCGMGGSHLPVGILKTIKPGIDIYVHRDYDLPPYEKSFLESSILVASSYSGNTAEAISFYKKTKQLYELPVVCITVGGELLKLAQDNNDPYILLPQTDFVPRTALGYSTLALAFLLKDKGIYTALRQIVLPIESIELEATKICDNMQGKIPVFYASQSNLHLAYNWKIKTNETAKIPAFYNVFPEANHNELEGYEYLNRDTQIMPVILFDSSDDMRIQKRFNVFEDILKEKNILYKKIDISNIDIYKKVFISIVLGDFVTSMIAHKKQVPEAEVPLIEAFKKRLI